MLTNIEFKKITEKCLYNKGFKKTKRRSTYYYETQDMFLCIIILRSYYSECYFLDYNFIIKAVHPDLSIMSIKDEDYDLIGGPRIRLKNGIVNLIPEELTMEYENILSETIDPIIDELNKFGIDYIKKVLKELAAKMRCYPEDFVRNSAKKVLL